MFACLYRKLQKLSQILIVELQKLQTQVDESHFFKVKPSFHGLFVEKEQHFNLVRCEKSLI